MGLATTRSRRINVTVPVDLDEAVRRRLGGEAAYSQLLQSAMRSLLACQHDQLRCERCGDQLTPAEIAVHALGRFFWDLTGQLEEYVWRGGTVTGFARVVKRLGTEHGIPGAAKWSAPKPARSVRERVARGDTWQESA